MTEAPVLSAADAALRAQKKQLREQVLARRDAMSPAERAAASAELTKRLLNLPGYNSAHVVSAYMGFGTEVDTAAFVARVLADGKQLVLPRIDKASKSLRLHRVTALADLVPGVWGILEPSVDAPAMRIDDIDFVLMPGVAFDASGARLGYGAGFYDRLLASGANPGKRHLRVTAAFDVQIVDTVPVDEHDQRLDIIISEQRILHANLQTSS